MIVVEYPRRLASLVRDRTGPLVKVCIAANVLYRCQKSCGGLCCHTCGLCSCLHGSQSLKARNWMQIRDRKYGRTMVAIYGPDPGGEE